MGYKGLQEVTRDYMGLQRIPETFFLARISLDSFSCFFLGIKITVEEIFNF